MNTVGIIGLQFGFKLSETISVGSVYVFADEGLLPLGLKVSDSLGLAFVSYGKGPKLLGFRMNSSIYVINLAADWQEAKHICGPKPSSAEKPGGVHELDPQRQVSQHSLYTAVD